MKKYYLDTCIWRDFFENRVCKIHGSLGKYALELLLKIKVEESVVIISDLIIEELAKEGFDKKLYFYLKKYGLYFEEIISTKKIVEKSKKISLLRNIPKSDVGHCLLAKEKEALLITRDNHFKKLVDISVYFKPEELI
jgi:hypothetical protein